MRTIFRRLFVLKRTALTEDDFASFNKAGDFVA